jgi:hypothetical protein
MVRLNLYNQDLFCGAQAILWEMEDLGVKPLPSIRTINRILSRHELTHRRTGKYEAKGTLYPKLPSILPNQSHQADMVGPCYLKGPVRFYSLNVVDMATVRCGLYPSLSKAGQSILDGFWSIWMRMGIPDHIQCHVLFRQPYSSPWYGTTYPALPAQQYRTLVYPSG